MGKSFIVIGSKENNIPDALAAVLADRANEFASEIFER